VKSCLQVSNNFYICNAFGFDRVDYTIELKGNPVICHFDKNSETVPATVSPTPENRSKLLLLMSLFANWRMRRRQKLGKSGDLPSAKLNSMLRVKSREWQMPPFPFLSFYSFFQPLTYLL